jgi:hypothetical protein
MAEGLAQKVVWRKETTEYWERGRRRPHVFLRGSAGAHKYFSVCNLRLLIHNPL